jgi:diguanylate cyclase (GGDEF)-like protein
MLLLAVVIVYCVIIHMLHDSRKIQHLMYNDWELNVRNMNYLVYQGQKLLNSRHKAPYAIICLNLSQYSLYNTIYGWRFGNKLLNSVISLLSQHLDKTEELYSRNHEDHFVLMMQLDHSDSSIRRLEHLQQTIEQQIAKDTNQHINVDMGVAFITEEHSDIRSAIAQADQALEFLNDNPASHIQIYDKHLDFYLKENHDRESLLDTADINKDFVVYYQEKVDIRTENIIGAEALVRFIDPASPDTIRSPGYFISYYEKTGRIRELDFFVLESACRMLRRRIDEGKPVVPVSCNFSRCHFTKEEFPQQLVEVLNRYDIPKKLIEVEITETIVMDELQHTMIQQTLQELARLGIRFSIDDFGSGYSSLGVFEQIPASVIKLDRSFLLNQTDRDRQVKIMKYVVTLARSLDTMVVCEGIETDTDVELMKEIGAYIAQGYRYSKPAPENTFEKHLDIQQENHKKKQSFHMVRNSVSSL